MKTVEHKLRFYHYSEDDAIESISDWYRFLEDVLPDAFIDYEPCKSDYGVFTIKLEVVGGET